MSNERELWEVEKYFGISFEDLDTSNSYDEFIYDTMMRIQCDWENGTMGKGIEYYASMYGF